MDGWLGMGHATIVAGRGGVGKTLLAQTLAAALAIGQDYIAAVPTARRVLLWACEDDTTELWRRQINIARYFGVPLAAFAENLFIIPRVGEDNAVMASDFGKAMWTPAYGLLSEAVNDLRADVLMVDNVGQSFAGNENSRADVSRFVNGFAGIRAGLSTLLLAHPAKANGSEFSGSSAWENVVRSRWFLGKKLPDDQADPDEDRDEDDAARYLCRRKANYSDEDFVTFTYTDGVLVPDAGDTLPRLDARFRGDLAESIVVKGVAKLIEMGRHPTDGKTSPDYLPRLIAEFGLQENLTRKDLASAMRSLMISGKLKRAVVGRYANRNDRFGLVVT